MIFLSLKKLPKSLLFVISTESKPANRRHLTRRRFGKDTIRVEFENIPYVEAHLLDVSEMGALFSVRESDAPQNVFPPHITGAIVDPTNGERYGFAANLIRIQAKENNKRSNLLGVSFTKAFTIEPRLISFLMANSLDQ